MLVLLIEDDEDLGHAITLTLRDDGYEVDWQTRGDNGLYRALEWDSDLIILDRMLPGLDGMEFLKKLRVKKQTPIIMLTALNRIEHRLEGFDHGADDYLGKPFELEELLARVKALARRNPQVIEQLFTFGDVKYDASSQKVWKSGESVILTRVELETLNILFRKQGNWVSRKILEDHLYRDEEDISPNALEVHIHRIRKKLGTKLIVTRRGLGYEIPFSS